MRQYDEPIVVRTDGEQPEQFMWQRKLWRIREIYDTWVESTDWWSDNDRFACSDRIVWRVEAGWRSDQSGIYELAQTGTHWVMRAVMD